MHKIAKITVSIAAAGLLVGSMAACSSTSSSDSSSSSSSPSAAATPAGPIATIPSLSGKDTQVTLDQGFADALTTLKLTAGVTGNATLVDGALHFPITGGNVEYFDPNAKPKVRPYVTGEIDHAGSGITLSNADKSIVVGLSDFVIDPGTSRLTGTVTANGKEVGTDIYIFNLDGSTLKPLAKDADGNAVLEGTRVLVSPDAAALLNKTFDTTAVTDTLLVGIAKITAN